MGGVNDILVAGDANAYGPLSLNGGARRIYGGFIPEEPWNDASERNPALSVTTISATSHHAVFCRNVNAATLLDGFTIVGGNADLDENEPWNGAGGGILCYSKKGDFTEASPTIQNCVVRGNYAEARGGGLACLGATTPPDGANVASPTVRDTAFLLNVVFGDVPDTDRAGGAIYVAEGSPQFVNCVIVRNTARLKGGAARVEGKASADFFACTIAENWVAATSLPFSTPVGGVSFGGSQPGTNGLLRVQLVDCILWENDDGDPDSPPTVANQYGLDAAGPPGGAFVAMHCDVMGLGTGGGSGNIDVDPEFLFPGAPDVLLFAMNYRVAWSSPCRDAGSTDPDPNTSADNFPLDSADADNDLNTNEPVPDLDRRARVIPTTGGPVTPLSIDMGAFELHCFADLTENGAVDADDLAVLLGAWGPCGPFLCPADLDFDGDVGPGDLALLLGAWGPCSPESGFGAAAMMASGEVAFEVEGGADVEAIAESMGFATVADFGAWMLSLSPAQRHAVAFSLFGVW